MKGTSLDYQMRDGSISLKLWGTLLCNLPLREGSFPEMEISSRSLRLNTMDIEGMKLNIIMITLYNYIYYMYILLK